MAHIRPHRRGFTLVEVLVVITIITILIAMLIPAVGYVIRRGHNFRRVTDLSQLDQAIEAYREKYGDYPPDFTDVFTVGGTPNKVFTQTIAYRHLKKVFPRIAPEELDLIRRINERPLTDPTRIDAAEALVLFLGGLSSNVRYPFTGANGPIIYDKQSDTFVWRLVDRNDPIFTFPEERLGPDPNDANRGLDEEYAPVYLPPGNDSTAPYVYFDSRNYAFSLYRHPVSPLTSELGMAVPYLARTAAQFANPETYQLICAGDDNLYAPELITNGTPVRTVYPSGLPWHADHTDPTDSWWLQEPQVHFFEGQKDNVTNFTNGQTLEDAQQS